MNGARALKCLNAFLLTYQGQEVSLLWAVLNIEKNRTKIPSHFFGSEIELNLICIPLAGRDATMAAIETQTRKICRKAQRN